MPGRVVRADDAHRALEERRLEELEAENARLRWQVRMEGEAGDDLAAETVVLRARVEALEAALAEIAAHDPYPVGVFTPLTEEEKGLIREALRTSGVRHPLDRTYAEWARHIGRQYAELARRALLDSQA